MDRPTIGLFRVSDPVEPWKAASPKANTPPSAPTSQYPFPSDVDAMPTIGRSSARFAMEPWNPASPKAKTPPSVAVSQYPRESGVRAMPSTDPLSGGVSPPAMHWPKRNLSHPRNAAPPTLFTDPVGDVIQ